MGTLRTMLVAVLAAAFGLTVTTPAGAEIKVGMVDTVRVMNSYQRTKDASEELEAEQVALKRVSDPKVKRIEELRLQRDGFNKESDEWKRFDEQALKAEMEFRTWLMYEQAKIERRHRGVMLDMYRQIQNVVQRIAKEKGLDVVFTKAFLAPPRIELDRAGTLDDLKQRIVAQRLLFPADPVDITQDVAKVLNGEYEAAKKAAADTPAPEE